MNTFSNRDHQERYYHDDSYNQGERDRSRGRYEDQELTQEVLNREKQNLLKQLERGRQSQDNRFGIEGRHQVRSNSFTRPPIEPLANTHDSLKVTESQLQRTIETNNLLRNKLEKAQEEIETCHNQIARQANHNHNLQIQIERLQHENDRLGSAQSDLIMKTQEEMRNQERMHKLIQDELAFQKKQLNLKEETHQSIFVANEQYKEKCYQLESEIASKIEEIDLLKARLRKFEEDLDQFYLNRGADNTYKFEIEQLKEDNRRLLKLLKQTNEYKEFSNFVDDSGGQVRSLDKENKQAQNTIQSQLDLIEEDQWAPGEAYQLAHNFRVQHGNALTPELVNQLLADLNKIWREREVKQIQRIKQQCQQEILTMKRQLAHRTPFDEVTAKKNISRLKNKLQNTKTELSKTQAIRDKQKNAPIGVELIDNTLQIVTSMQQQKKVLEVENESLKERVRKLETININLEYDKKKYMEGAVWMGRKVTNEIERVCQQVDSIIKEYHQRIDDQARPNSSSFAFRPTDIVTLQRCQAWFLEAIKNSSYELYEKSVTMLESAIIHLDEAQKKLTDVLPNSSATKDETGANLITQVSVRTGRMLNEYSNKKSESESDMESVFKATAKFRNQ